MAAKSCARPYLMHGKLSKVQHTGKGIFAELPQDFSATRYHSLIVERESLPKELIVTAETPDSIIMGMQHTDYPVHGVQFHPESIASRVRDTNCSQTSWISRA